MLENKRSDVPNALSKITLLLILFTLLVYSFIYNYQHTFSTEKWVNHPTWRAEMLNDLLTRYELIGMSKKDIISVLGNDCLFDSVEPITFKLSKVELDPSDVLLYYIGEDYMEDVWLIICLERNTVNNYFFDVT